MILFANQDFSSLNSFLETQNPTKIFILVDENTHEHCLPKLLPNLETDIPFEIIEIESGEENKTIENAIQLWEILSGFEANRKSLIINLGGGVITDLGGFVASTYKRGVSFINIPTTLLGMCDASIGGKTGIDHQSLKNIIGTFAEPEHIFIYPDFLSTLPFTELRSGFAEMLKHGLIADKKHWEDLISIEELSAGKIFPYIETSMKIKQNVVEKDFKEQNIRKTLNFGHTFGHAFETLFLQKGKPILHGEAVAMGMIVETYLSFSEILIPENTALEIINNIRRYYPHISINGFSDDEILSLMMNDKKNSSGKINFSLLKNIGESVYDFTISAENIISGLEFYRSLN